MRGCYTFAMAKKTPAKRRKAPGSTGKGKFYHIEVRPKYEFTTFRVQDVGEPGGLERLAGKRPGPGGTWDTVTWLVSKDDAYVDERGHLKMKGKAQVLTKQFKGRIVHVKGDIFKAHEKNVREADKPTPAMRKARRANIRKAQTVRQKK
jgi:hypothetical protein